MKRILSSLFGKNGKVRFLIFDYSWFTEFLYRKDRTKERQKDRIITRQKTKKTQKNSKTNKITKKFRRRHLEGKIDKVYLNTENWTKISTEQKHGQVNRWKYKHTGLQTDRRKY
jgi:hypothetical protein